MTDCKLAVFPFRTSQPEVFMFAITTPLTLVAFVSVPAVVIISMKYGKIM